MTEPVLSGRRFGPSRRAARTTTALVVAHDDLVRRQMVHALERENIEVAEVTSSQTAMRTMFDARPDLVVVDLALPAQEGWGLVERVRQICDAPLVVLGDGGGEAEVVRALNGGADVHVPRPLSTLELTAFVAAVLRRSSQPDDEARTFYHDGLVEVDLLRAEARVLGEPLQLTPLEMRLLIELMEHPNQTLSSMQLLERVWGDNVTGSDRVKIYIGYLRAKLRAAGAEPPIVTVRGFGYRYVVQAA
jgi:DNA-binding response OmpR family regulator